MNKFLQRITIYFLLPFVIYCIIEGFLPFNTYTFRHSEGQLFKSRLHIPHLTNGLIADEIIRMYKKTPLPEGSDVTLFK